MGRHLVLQRLARRDRGVKTLDQCLLLRNRFADLVLVGVAEERLREKRVGGGGYQAWTVCFVK